MPISDRERDALIKEKESLEADLAESKVSRAKLMEPPELWNAVYPPGKAFIAGAVNQALLNLPNLYPPFKEKSEELQRQYPGAYKGGEMTGTVASFIPNAPGNLLFRGIGKAASAIPKAAELYKASRLARIAGSGLQTGLTAGAEEGIRNTPELLGGDVTAPEVKEKMKQAALMGGALGGGTQAAGEIISPVAGGLKRFIFKSAFPTPPEISQAGVKAEAKAEARGKKEFFNPDRTNEQADILPVGTKHRILVKSHVELDKYDKMLQDELSSIDVNNWNKTSQELKTEFNSFMGDKVKDKLHGLGDAGKEAYHETVSDVFNRFADKAEGIGPKELQHLKRNVVYSKLSDKNYLSTETAGIRKEALMDVGSFIRDKIENIAEQNRPGAGRIIKDLNRKEGDYAQLINRVVEAPGPDVVRSLRRGSYLAAPGYVAGKALGASGTGTALKAAGVATGALDYASQMPFPGSLGTNLMSALEKSSKSPKDLLSLLATISANQAHKQGGE